MDDNLVLDQIRGDLIPEAWPHMEPFFRRAAQRVSTTDHTPQMILLNAVANKISIWAIYDPAEPLPLLGVAATAIYGKMVRIESFGGRDFFRWGREALRKFEALAKAKGMNRIEISGRFGWYRVFPEYRPCHITLGKMLSSADEHTTDISDAP